MAHGKHSTIIFGCGNVIMGDDGFGIREYLVGYLLTPESRSERLNTLDAALSDRRPGEVVPVDVSSIPAKKIHDFSFHQFPSINLPLKLQGHKGMSVDIPAAQVELIPEQIAPGLFLAMSCAVSPACEKILQLLSASGRIQGEQP